MKKFLPILLAGFVAITVVACSGEEAPAAEEVSEEAPTEEVSEGDAAGEVSEEFDGWPDEEKSAYLDACAIDADMADYCECTLDKVMEASPDPADAISVDIMAISMECIDLMPGMEGY